jgi:DNA-binding CsgD family transcriptional regulator
LGATHADCFSGEIAGLALTATSQHEFRAEVLRRFIAWSGGDCGLIHQHYPSTAPLETGTYEQMDMDYARRCVAGWDIQYGRDMEPVLQDSLTLGGVGVDRRSTRTRSRLAFYADILEPCRVREGVFCTVELGRRPLALCILNRTRKERLLGDSLATLRALLPVFTLGDRLLARRPPQPGDEPPIARLSPREREVAQLLTLGYTNPEIALALSSSVHTVRNQVASIFRKAGVSTRAELAGLARGVA